MFLPRLVCYLVRNIIQKVISVFFFCDIFRKCLRWEQEQVIRISKWKHPLTKGIFLWTTTKLHISLWIQLLKVCFQGKNRKKLQLDHNIVGNWAGCVEGCSLWVHFRILIWNYLIQNVIFKHISLMSN